MKISARNTFSGTITAMSTGPVSTEVTIKIAPKLEIVSVITTNSANQTRQSRPVGSNRNVSL